MTFKGRSSFFKTHNLCSMDWPKRCSPTQTLHRCLWQMSQCIRGTGVSHRWHRNTSWRMSLVLIINFDKKSEKNILTFLKVYFKVTHSNLKFCFKQCTHSKHNHFRSAVAALHLNSYLDIFALFTHRITLSILQKK